MHEMTFEEWYHDLKLLAELHGANVSDEDAWREEFFAKRSVEAAFYGEYPEYKEEL